MATGIHDKQPVTHSLTIGDEWKVAKCEVRYLVLNRNERDEVELVDEYVGMTVLREGKSRSRDMTSS